MLPYTLAYMHVCTWGELGEDARSVNPHRLDPKALVSRFKGQAVIWLVGKANLPDQ